ncbi:MAG: isoprenyl transferase [Clostridiales bacterium]|nr:isoprenyl transferase [Clostridiales bacterium]
MEEIKIPKHIAFIMDGNGRWAKKRALPRKAGHKAGVDALKKVIEECQARGVQMCSFYAFSTENWKRPQDEINAIFKLVEDFAANELKKYVDKNYRVMCMGDLSLLPQKTQDSLKEIVDSGKNNTGMIVNIAINYGGRQEIVNAINYILQSGINKVDEQMVSDCIYTAGLPDPDIIVRTSGEERISNFMLWQLAYSEFLFIDTLWPDMDKKDIDYIINEYSKRNRRFGDIK